MNRSHISNLYNPQLGLVPKVGNKTRLIFHLSYDFDGKAIEGKSLNFHTPKHLCSVKYNDLDHAIHAMLKMACRSEDAAGQFAMGMPGRKPKKVYSGKTDVSSTFRLVPLLWECWKWLVMKAQHPETGQWCYFIDKCLPFGASISCAIFQRVSDALKHLTEARASAQDMVTNYLDDFLFIALTLIRCNYLIQEFLNLCSEIGIPIALDKTDVGSYLDSVLGNFIDGEHLRLRVHWRRKIGHYTSSMVCWTIKKQQLKNYRLYVVTLTSSARQFSPAGPSLAGCTLNLGK